MVLSQAGLQVEVATSAESALALLRTLSKSQDIGVIVTDHIMPQATGSEFVRLVRSVFLSLRTEPYVEAAISVDCATWRPISEIEEVSSSVALATVWTLVEVCSEAAATIPA